MEVEFHAVCKLREEKKKKSRVEFQPVRVNAQTPVISAISAPIYTQGGSTVSCCY